MNPLSGILRFVDGMSRGLRWLLFLPVGLGSSLLLLAIIENIFYRLDPTRPAVVQTSILAFLASGTRTLFPAVISPRPWPVAIILFTLDTLLRGVPIVGALIRFEYLRARGPLPLVIVGAGIAGGCVALYLVARGTKQ